MPKIKVTYRMNVKVIGQRQRLMSKMKVIDRMLQLGP